MKNQHTAHLFDATQNLTVVEDNNNKPMIFYTTDSRTLNVFKYNEETGNYQAINISCSFNKGCIVQSYSVIQVDNKIIFSLICSYESNYYVFVSKPIENNYSVKQWKNIKDICVKIKGINNDFRPYKLHLSYKDNLSNLLLLIAGESNSFKYYYQYTLGETCAKKCEYPEDIKKNQNSLRQIEVNSSFGQLGKYFMYNIGKTQTLACTTIADDEEGSISYDYSPTNDNIISKFKNLIYNCFTTAVTVKSEYTSADIFIGAKSGVYYIPQGRCSRISAITTKIKDIHKLFVANYHNKITVWALCSGNKLYYIKGRYEERSCTTKWDEPILFSDKALNISAIINSQKNSNEMIIVYDDFSIHHFWQCHDTSLWSNRVLKLPKLSKLLTSNTFTTHINVKHDDKDINLHITSSHWVYAYVNGKLYSIDKNSPTIVSPDVMGNITIITTAKDISCPTYTINMANGKNTIEVKAYSKIHRSLSNIKSADDLKQAVNQSGHKVISKKVNEQTIESLVYNLNLLTKVSDNSQSDMLTTVSSGALIGDVLHFIEQKFNNVTNTINKGLIELEDGTSLSLNKLDGVLNFTFLHAGDIIAFQVNGLNNAFKIISVMFKLIGIDLNQIMDWLGHLFGYTDILKTSDKLLSYIDKFSDLIEDNHELIFNYIKKSLKTMQHTINSKELSKIKVKQSGEDNFNNALQNPTANWALYHLLHGDLLQIKVSIKPKLSAKIQSKLSKILSKQLVIAEKEVQELINSLISNINKKSFVNSLKDIFRIIELLAYEELQECLELFSSVVKDIIIDIKRALNTSLNIPLISELFKLSLGGRKLTLARVIAIIMATQLRVVYKLSIGKSLNNNNLKDLNVNINSLLNYTDNKLKFSENQNNDTISTELYMTYLTARFLESVFANISLVSYMTSKQSSSTNLKDIAISAGEIACGFLASYIIAYNLYQVDKVTVSNDSNSEVCTVELLDFSTQTVLLACSFISAYDSNYEKAMRIISFSGYCVLQGIVTADYLFDDVEGETGESNNLRFLSNTMLNSYKAVTSYFAKGSPLYLSATSLGCVTAHLAANNFRLYLNHKNNEPFRLV